MGGKGKSKFWVKYGIASLGEHGQASVFWCPRFPSTGILIDVDLVLVLKLIHVAVIAINRVRVCQQ